MRDRETRLEQHVEEKHGQRALKLLKCKESEGEKEKEKERFRNLDLMGSIIRLGYILGKGRECGSWHTKCS